MRPTAPMFPRSTRRSSIRSRPSGRRSEPLIQNATVVLAAQLRAQHVLRSWHNTETRWQAGVPLSAGPFEFDYRYQRADLVVSRGPLPYGSSERLSGATVEQVTYTGSGMAAI